MQLSLEMGFTPNILEGGNLRSYYSVMRHVERGYDSGQTKDQRPRNIQYQNTASTPGAA